MILAFINSNIVKNLFFALLILAIVILLITTFAATIKTEFNKDGNNNKRKVIKNAFRGLANFVLVPLICFFALFVGNMLLRAIDGATSGGSSVYLSRQMFMAGAYNANRVRQDEVEGEDAVRYKETSDDHFSYGALIVGVDGSGTGYGNFGIFIDDTSGKNQRRAADKIDDFFANGYSITIGSGVFNGDEYSKIINKKRVSDVSFSSGDSANANTLAFKETEFYNGGKGMKIASNVNFLHQGENEEVENKKVAAKTGMITFEEGDTVYFSIYNIGLVYYYYDLTLTGFNYIISAIALFFCAWVLIVTVLGLIKRIFMLSTLFIISAPICAIYPLDDGKALEQWRKEFIKETLSAYAVVVVMNIFLALLPLMSKMNVFVSGELWIFTGFANHIARVLIVVAALTFFKDATKTIASLIGAGDSYDAGDGAKKNFATNVGRVAAGGAVALGTGALVGKGIGKLIGLGAGAVSKMKDNSFAKSAASNELARRQKALEEAGVEGKAENSTDAIGDGSTSMNSSNASNVVQTQSNPNSAVSNSMNNNTAQKDKPIDWHYERKKAQYEKRRNNRITSLEARYDKKTSLVDGNIELEDEEKKKMNEKLTNKLKRRKERVNNRLDKKEYNLTDEGIKERNKKRTNFIKKVKDNHFTRFVGGTVDAIKGIAKGDLNMKEAWKDSTTKGSKAYRDKQQKDAEKKKAQVEAKQREEMLETLKNIEKNSKK